LYGSYSIVRYNGRARGRINRRDKRGGAGSEGREGGEIRNKHAETRVDMQTI